MHAYLWRRTLLTVLLFWTQTDIVAEVDPGSVHISATGTATGMAEAALSDILSADSFVVVSNDVRQTNPPRRRSRSIRSVMQRRLQDAPATSADGSQELPTDEQARCDPARFEADPVVSA
jgi:hypothetical protein